MADPIGGGDHGGLIGGGAADALGLPPAGQGLIGAGLGIALAGPSVQGSYYTPPDPNSYKIVGKIRVTNALGQPIKGCNVYFVQGGKIIGQGITDGAGYAYMSGQYDPDGGTVTAVIYPPGNNMTPTRVPVQVLPGSTSATLVGGTVAITLPPGQGGGVRPADITDSPGPGYTNSEP